MYSKIQEYLKTCSDFSAIPTARKELLKPLADYIAQRHKAGNTVKLIFICTHNSRRSHFGQVWAQLAAHYYGISPVEFFSGGTETTACNPRTVAALERTGIQIKAITSGENPVYLFQYANGINPIVAFSKVYDQPPNPSADFAAVLTCSHAEENCPFIPGAEKRFAITYEDPKVSDGTAQESIVYDARCRQIAAEMMYVFGGVKKE